MSEPQSGWIGLVGCVKMKGPHAVAAKDLYTSPLFRGRRDWVEHSCSRWFILSAAHGLVDPEVVLAPYDVSLVNMPAAARRAWSVRVMAQLTERLGSLQGVTFDAHAGETYLEFGLRSGLEAAGARVLMPARGLTQGRQLALYRDARTARGGA